MTEKNDYSISIIVPVHNEELRVERGVSRICKYFEDKQYDYQVIIAEDGSRDKTVELIKKMEKENSRIKVISSSNRLGKGKAISEAMVRGEKDFVGYMDVDLAADPMEFERLLEKIEDYDIAIGSRLLRGNLPRIKRPFYRTITSFFYSRFYRILFHNSIIDPQCGFKLFKKEIVSKLFSEIKTTGFAFDSEVIVKAFSLQFRIVEVPIVWSHEKASKLKVSEQIQQMGKELIMIWYNSHLKWLNGEKIYPQKKGSIFGKLLFQIIKIIKKD